MCSPVGVADQTAENSRWPESESGKAFLRIQPVVRHYTHVMPRMINGPTVIQAAGNRPKRIEEYAGRINTGQQGVSVARMRSPEGWEEPGQRPEFEEITIVLRGTLRVEYEGGVLDVGEDQGVVTAPGEWVRYSTPF